MGKNAVRMEKRRLRARRKAKLENIRRASENDQESWYRRLLAKDAAPEVKEAAIEQHNHDVDVKLAANAELIKNKQVPAKTSILTPVAPPSVE